MNKKSLPVTIIFQCIRLPQSTAHCYPYNLPPPIRKFKRQSKNSSRKSGYHYYSVYHLLADVMQRKKLIDLACVLDLDNYVLSLDRWLQMPIHVKTKDERQDCFDKYLPIVKPMVHRFHTLTSSLDERQYGFYTNSLRASQVKVLVDSYETLRKFEIFAKDDCNALETEGKYCYLAKEEIAELVKKPEPDIYKIDLSEAPKNKELAYWGTYLEVKRVSFASEVIHGKGIAKKSLGFPTANLKVSHEIEEQLNCYPNGVYLVRFTFVSGNAYYGVCCVGTNPHYQNATNQRFVEVYVYHDFGEQLFYGAKTSLELLVLMRFEGKFETFDCFLNAMHNDIETGKTLAHHLNYCLE